MKTITLSIDSKIYENFLLLLQQFKNGEVKIIETDESFTRAKNHLQKEYETLNDVNAEFLTFEEFENQTLKAISFNED
jgi:hypothetical protein